MSDIIVISKDELNGLLQNAVQQALIPLKNAINAIIPKKEESDFISRQEAKELLKIGTTKLWQLTKDQYITPKYIGKKVYFSRQEILNFIEGL